MTCTCPPALSNRSAAAAVLLSLAACQPAPPPAPAPAPIAQAAPPPPPPPPTQEAIPGLVSAPPVTVTGLCEPSAIAADGDVLRMLDDDRKKQVFSVPVGQGGAASRARRLLDSAPYPLNDAEAVAVDGDVRWWVTSHSRSKDGTRDETRERLVRTDRSGLTVEATYSLAGLRSALAAPLCPTCAVPADFEALPAKAGGLDIEGLAVSPEGALMVGLRGPLTVEGRALVLSLPPDGLATPQVAAAWALDLGGRGIRSLERIPGEPTYLLIAGPLDTGDRFDLLHWTPGVPPVPIGPIPLPEAGTAPEGLAILSADAQTVSAVIAFDEGGRVAAAQAGAPEVLHCDDLLDGSPAQVALVRARLVTLVWTR